MNAVWRKITLLICLALASRAAAAEKSLITLETPGELGNQELAALGLAAPRQTPGAYALHWQSGAHSLYRAVNVTEPQRPRPVEALRSGGDGCGRCCGSRSRRGSQYILVPQHPTASARAGPARPSRRAPDQTHWRWSASQNRSVRCSGRSGSRRARGRRRSRWSRRW